MNIYFFLRKCCFCWIKALILNNLFWCYWGKIMLLFYPLRLVLIQKLHLFQYRSDLVNLYNDKKRTNVQIEWGCYQGSAEQLLLRKEVLLNRVGPHCCLPYRCKWFPSDF